MRCYFPLLGFCFSLSLLICSGSYAQEAQLLLPYGHTAKVNSISFSKDDAFILTHALDSSAGLWHVSSGKLVWFDQGIIEAHFMGNENTLLILAKGKGISSLDLTSLQTTLILTNKDEQVQAFRFNEKEGAIAIRKADNTTIKTDASTWTEHKPIQQLPYKTIQIENIGVEGSILCLTPEGYLIELNREGRLSYIYPSKGYSLQAFKIFGDQILALDQQGKVILFQSRRATKPLPVSGTFTLKLFNKFEVINGKLWLINDNTVQIYSTVNGELLKSNKANRFFSGYLPVNDSTVFAFNADSLYKLSEDASILSSFHFPDRINSISTNSDRTLLSFGHFNGSISLFDTKYNTIQRTLKKHTSKPQFIGKTSNNGDFIIGLPSDEKIIWNIKGIRPMYGPSTIEKPSPEIQCETLFIRSEICSDTIFIIDRETNRVIHTERKQGTYTSAFLSSTCWKAATFLEDHSIKLIDLSKSTFTILNGHTATVNHVEFFPDQNRLLSVSDDETFKIWNLTSGELLTTGLILDSENSIQYTSDLYYSGTKSAVVTLGWKNGKQIFSFDQFDLQKNRPDLVLERLENDNTDLIQAYHLAHLKRLKRMNIGAIRKDSVVALPSIKISNKDKIPLSTENAEIVLNISASSPSEKISSIHVFINEVPIFGEKGSGYGLRNETNVMVDIPVVLSRGINKIEVMTVTESGATSLKDQLWIQRILKDGFIPQSYFVSFSVDQFKEPGHDLTYAVKDGRDMAKALNEIKNAHIDTFFNSSATRDQFLKTKEKLMHTQVDDEVILFLSGHGILDTNYNFFFASYDTEFEHPATKGISLEDIHFLMDGIPARKKLILLDACHSGEIDRSEMVLSASKTENTNPVKIIGIKGAEAQNTSELKLNDSFILMQESFIELNKNSGSTFISASSGTGYAYESEEWNNGVFSYCILNGLLHFNADQDKNGTISTHELKRYVIREVDRLTKGMQIPTCREEINEFDWILRQ